MKKVLVIFTLIIVLFTGCKKNEEDYQNEKNYKEYLKTTFYERYNKELTIDNHVEKSDKYGSITHIMDVHLKEIPDIVFKACTYWDVSAAIPTRNYTYASNYEDIYKKKILEEHLETITYGNLFFESIEQEYSNECILEKYTSIFEFNDLNNIDDFAEILDKIGKKEYLYSIHIKVKYKNNNQNIIIKKEYDKSFYIEKLYKLI